MKPMGAIPPDFGVAGGMLLAGGKPVDRLVAEAGDTPLFIYDLDIVADRIARFRAAFPSVGLHYAIKANPYAPLLTWIANHVDGLDVASGGELGIVADAGAKASHISFAGPGKRDADLAAAISAGVTVNCESEGEATRILRIAGEQARRARVAVRVNPDFEIRGSGMRMGGGAKPFGVDAERVPSLVRFLIEGGADWRGFHIFAGSQALSADAIIEAQAATLDLAAALSSEIGRSPPLVNLGGGFGIPYFHGEQPLDVERIGAALEAQLAARPPILGESRFAIELGRWLVGECGIYLTRILDRKISKEKLFLVTDGGMHHQLAASGNFGQVVRRNYPVAIANRMDEAAVEEASIVGCLCTPLDRLADDVRLPEAGPGDIVAVFLAGAYSLTASPQSFLAQAPAREMIVGKRV